MTVQLERAQLGQTAGARVFTIGYEGRPADGFLKDLTGSGVQILVDVREMPIGRKRGFSKSTLSELVQKAGIEHLHISALPLGSGSPPGWPNTSRTIRTCDRRSFDDDRSPGRRSGDGVFYAQRAISRAKYLPNTFRRTGTLTKR